MKKSIRAISCILLILAFIAISVGLTSIAVKSIKLNSTSIKISAGKTYKLNVIFTPENATNKKLTFLSANKKIASVTQNGYIKGIIPGKTVITVKSTTNKNAVAKCNVTVLPLKHLNISMIVYNPPNYVVEEGTPVQKLIEDRYNITIRIHKLDTHNTEQRSLFWAEGKKFDVMQTNYGHEDWKLAEQNIIRPISEEMLKKNMPIWMSRMEKLYDPKDIKKSMTYNGKYWGIPFDQGVETVVNMLVGIRADWMKNVGVTRTPETIDEFHDLLYKFTYKDPDKNGKNDTYGMHGGHAWFKFNPVDAAFGVRPGAYYDQDGKIVYANTTKQFKEFLKLLNKWFKEGVIHPEFVTSNESTEFISGTIGMRTGHPWHFAETGSNWLKLLKEKNPKAELVYCTGLKGNDGKLHALGYKMSYAQNAIYFSKDASDEVVERIMRFKEDLATDREFYERCYYGIKGEDYFVDEDGVYKRPKEFLDKADELTAKKGIGGIFGMYYGWPNRIEETISYKDRPIFNLALSALPVYDGLNFTVTKPNEILRDKQKDIDTISSEFYLNAITGSIDIDTNWDSYIDKLNKAGLTEVLKEFERLIIR